MQDHSALDLLRRGQRAAGIRQCADAAARGVLAGRIDEAETLLRAALAIAPDAAVLLARLAGIRQLRGDETGALALARTALHHDPGESMAATIAIDALVTAGLAGEAAAVGQAALARAAAPSVARALSQALLMMGRAPDALAQARSALTADPSNDIAVATVCFTALYDDTLDARARAQLIADAAARLRPAAGCGPLRPRTPLAGRRIRIGLLSPDLRDHPMGYFAAPLLARLNRGRFEVYAYARVTPDQQTTRLRAIPDLVWRDTLGLDDAAVHRTIQDDAIDVLVDLAAHTHGGRPRLIAARAAPVQLAWLGFPHATGLPNMDGMLADSILCPPDSHPTALERVLPVSGCALCLPPAADAPPISSAPSTRGAAFTFGSFNHLAKLSDATVALWARVLAAVPGSRLALCAFPLRDAQVRRFTMSRFERCGVDPRRVLLLPPRRPLWAFLTQYDSIDVALDPLPFNGGTTTLQALWQGVPVISLPGSAPQQRMGASILTAARLESMCVADDAQHYVALAQAFAARTDALAALRASMRERLAPLTDSTDFATRFGVAVARFASGHTDALA